MALKFCLVAPLEAAWMNDLRAEFFEIRQARDKLKPAQVPFLDRLLAMLSNPGIPRSFAL